MYIPGGGGFQTTVMIDAFDDNAVTAHFRSDGMVRRGSGGGITLISDDPRDHDWVAVIPYGEAYDVSSQTMDGGFTFIFTFTKNP